MMTTGSEANSLDQLATTQDHCEFIDAHVEQVNDI